jgi:hypothetical protein
LHMHQAWSTTHVPHLGLNHQTITQRTMHIGFVDQMMESPPILTESPSTPKLSKLHSQSLYILSKWDGKVSMEHCGASAKL